MRTLSIAIALSVAILALVLSSMAALADGWPSVSLPL
jgi:hypothetical protein